MTPVAQLQQLQSQYVSTKAVTAVLVATSAILILAATAGMMMNPGAPFNLPTSFAGASIGAAAFIPVYKIQKIAEEIDALKIEIGRDCEVEDDYALLEDIDPSEPRKPLCSRIRVLQLEEMKQQLTSAKAITVLLIAAVVVAEVATILAMIAFAVVPATVFYGFSVVLAGPALLSLSKTWEIAREVDVLKAIAVRPEREDCYTLLEEKP